MAKLNSGTRIFGTANVDSTLVVGSVSPQAPSVSSNSGTLQVGSALNFSDTGIIANFASNTNSYSQIINQNSNTGTLASSDFIVNNDSAAQGTSIYGDFGINSTIFNNPSDVFGDASGTYLYSAGGSLTQGTLNNFDYKLATNNIVRLTANGTTGNIAIANNLSVSGNVGIGGSVTATNGFYVSGASSPGSQYNIVGTNISASGYNVIGGGGYNFNDGSTPAIIRGSTNYIQAYVNNDLTNSQLWYGTASGLLIGNGSTPGAKLDVVGTARISGITTITNSTASTSNTTGALVVSGGVGISGNLFSSTLITSGLTSNSYSSELFTYQLDQGLNSSIAFKSARGSVSAAANTIRNDTLGNIDYYGYSSSNGRSIYIGAIDYVQTGNLVPGVNVSSQWTFSATSGPSTWNNPQPVAYLASNGTFSSANAIHTAIYTNGLYYAANNLPIPIGSGGITQGQVTAIAMGFALP